MGWSSMRDDRPTMHLLYTLELFRLKCGEVHPHVSYHFLEKMEDAPIWYSLKLDKEKTAYTCGFNAELRRGWRMTGAKSKREVAQKEVIKKHGDANKQNKR